MSLFIHIKQEKPNQQKLYTETDQNKQFNDTQQQEQQHEGIQQ